MKRIEILFLLLMAFMSQNVIGQTCDPTTYPTITCPQDVTVNVPNGSCQAAATVEAPSSTDACFDANTMSSKKLNGSNQYIQIPNHEDFKFTRKMTVEAWIYIDAMTVPTSKDIRIIGKGADLGYGLWYYPGNPGRGWPSEFRFQCSKGYGYNSVVYPAIKRMAIQTGRWYHVAGVQDGGSTRLYIDGRLRASYYMGSNTITTNNSPLIIGQGALSIYGAGYHNGKVDEVRVWNVARTAQQIFDYHDKLIPTNSPNLLACYRFEDALNDSTVIDLTGNGHNGVLKNGVTHSMTNAPLVHLIHNTKNGISPNVSGDYTKGFHPETFTITNVQGNTSSCDVNITVNAPEMEITGRNLPITDGENSPADAKNTDFGAQNPGVIYQRVFKVWNNGSMPLVVDSATVSNSVDFYTSGFPLTVQPGDNGNFYVHYNPFTFGPVTGTVSVFSNDCDNSPYTFGIAGEALCEGIRPTITPAHVGCPGVSDGAILVNNINGGQAPYTYSMDGGNTFNNQNGFPNLAAGTYTIVVKDKNGCMSVPAPTQVNVGTDNIDPTFNGCSGNIVMNAAAGTCGRIVTFASPTATDNCYPNPSVTQIKGPASGSTFQIGSTEIVFEADDTYGNKPKCIFNVIINDNEDPSITCPANITVNNDLGVCGAMVNYTVNSSDLCTSVSHALTAGQASGTLFPMGTTTNTYKATDAYNNEKTCSFTVTVIDNENPVMTCPANISVNTEAGRCDAVINYGVSSSDNCGGVSHQLTVGFTSGNYFPKGVTTTTFRATDAEGNIHDCSFTVTVSDNENPSITCPSNISVNTDAGRCDAVVTYASSAFTTSDNCAIDQVFQTDATGLSSGDAFPKGTTTLTYTAADEAGNTSACSFDILVSDNENPVISCPANQVVGNDAGICGATVTFAVTSTDNCGNASITQTDVTGLASGSVFPVGTTTLSYQATDASNNVHACSFEVTVQDTEAPVLTCPANMVVTNDPGNCGAMVSYTIGSTDNCTTVNHAQTDDSGLSSGDFFPKGMTYQTYTATDGVGNTQACSFSITVVDNELPVITCPSDITVNSEVGTCGAIVAYQVSATDNCPGENLIQTSAANLASDDSYPVGVTAKSFEVIDAAGNTATCSFTITVVDIEYPTITCPSDITVSTDLGVCGAQVSFPVIINDNCTIPVLEETSGTGLASGDIFPVGTTLMAFKVSDGSANTANCNFSITVNDDEMPIIACPSSPVVRDTDNGMCEHVAVGQDLDVSITDNCQVALMLNTYSGSSSLAGAVFPKGKTTVTWVATDIHGNQNTCTYEVKIRDKEAPIFDNCPDDTTITIPFNAGGSYYTWDALTAIDNCNNPGQLTITGFPLSGSFFSVGTMAVNWTATDKRNNVGHCDFEVTVVEQGAPTPSGWTNGGVGSSNSCATNYDAATGTLTILTSGGNISGTSDQFCGITIPSSDQIIDFRARVTPPGMGYNDQAGIMMRQSLNGNAACASMCLTGTAIPVMGFRPSTGSMPMGTAGTAVTAPYWVRLYRFGPSIQGYISADGVNWTMVKSYPNVLSSPLYLGLFAKTSGAQGTATIDNISINGSAARMGIMTEETALSLEAYPNPFSEDLFIKVANALPGETYRVRLSNMMGQRVYGYETGASPAGTIDQRISLEHLPAGNYLLEVSAGVQREVLKVVKQ